MLELIGWGNPGRAITDKTHLQIYGLISYMQDVDRIENEIWSKSLKEKIKININVNTQSTLRHLIGLMKSIGIIYEDSFTTGEVPNVNHIVTPKGQLLYSLLKSDIYAKEQENVAVIKEIQNMYKEFYTNAFIYWYVRGTDIHVARTVMKTLKKFESLNKMEWFIMNTFITQTDNKEQEEIVEEYINKYRSGGLTLTEDNIIRNENAFGYWKSILNFTGLIKKDGNNIYIGNSSPEFCEAILAPDFLETLDTSDRYNI